MPNLLVWAGAIGSLVLVLTWIGYPVVIGILSVLPRAQRRGSGHSPKVSVILATRDSDEIIEDRIRNILLSNHPEDLLEVIVAIDPSGRESLPDLRQIGDGFKITVVWGNEPGGKASTLNAGASQATGQVLVFTDAHQRFTPESIPELMAVFSDPHIGAASGSLILPERGDGVSAVDLYWQLERWLRSRESRIHSSVGVTGAIWAIRAGLWEALPAGLILDDLFSPMRLVMAGHRVAHVATALAYETREVSPLHEHLRKTRTLTGNLQFFAWVPQVFLPWKNPLFLQFMFHKVFRLLTPFASLLVLFSGIGLLAMARPQLLPWGLAVLAALLVWLRLGWPPPAIPVRRVLTELVLTQTSILKALFNGVRGRWDVWAPGDGPTGRQPGNERNSNAPPPPRLP